MIKILIADDEQLERTTLKAIMSKKYDDKVTLFEAKNGRQAIEICDVQKPDIVIMDIKMPGINGLEAIKNIKTFLPNTYFIILTAYDYFDFAREALECGVKEYILKPLNREGFLKKIDFAFGQIEKEKQNRKHQIEAQEKIYNVIPMLENELSYCILNDNLSSINYETYMEYLNLRFNKGCCVVARIDDNYDYNTEDDKKIRIRIGEFLKEFISKTNKVIGSYRFTNYITFFIDYDESIEDEKIIMDSINHSRTLVYETRKRFNISLIIGIGMVYKGIENMHLSFLEANKCLSDTQKNTDVIHYKEIAIVNSHAESKAGISNNHRDLFNKVIDYITENYSKDIGLEMVSKKFNLSSYHFSRTFKEIFKISFSEMLTSIRMDKAKELLEKENSNVKNVCFEVGYNDPNYFSRAFKKYTGMSPSEYKNKQSS